MIRTNVKSKFAKCKDIQYLVLLNLLDNYSSVVLSIYSVVFKLNDFKNYLMSFVRAWVMFVCFKRRHYDKSLLIWFGTYLYWKERHPELAHLLETFVTIFDEYVVENTHSIIRRTINLLDPMSVMVKKVKAIFANTTAQATFRETFGYTKNYTFSKNEMRYLKLKATKFILGCLRKISSQQSNVQFKVVNGQKVWKMPCLLGKLSSTYDFFLSVFIQKYLQYQERLVIIISVSILQMPSKNGTLIKAVPTLFTYQVSQKIFPARCVQPSFPKGLENCVK